MRRPPKTASSARSNGDSTGSRRWRPRVQPARSKRIRQNGWRSGRRIASRTATGSSRSSRATTYTLDGDRLTFPSAVRTPHPENNIVHGRYFPAPSERGRRRAVVVLPQWNADAEGHIGLCRLLNRFRHHRAAPQPSVPRRADAAGAAARRLHRQLERRPHGAGLPPGGARCPARDCVARDAGVRVDRDPGHQPRIVSRDADGGARAAGARRRAQSRLAVLRRRDLGRSIDRARARGPERAHRARRAAADLDADLAFPVHRAPARQAACCSCTRGTT